MSSAVRLESWKWVGGLALVAAAALGGCPRSIAFYCDPAINANVKREGEPLEIAIVCVYPEDLESKDGKNQGLSPENLKLTSKDWFGEGQREFVLPARQVHVLASDSRPGTTYKGGPLVGSGNRGGAAANEKPVLVKGIQFDGGWLGARLHHRNSVIYVFGKFLEKDGTVSSVRPAIFNPPGAYSSELAVRVRKVSIEVDDKHCPRVLH